MSLLPDQVTLFRHNGFLKLPGTLPVEHVEALKAAIWTDVESEVEPVVRNRDGRVVRLSAVWQRGGIFKEVFSSDWLLDSLESLIGPNIELLLNRHNHATLRLAGDGGEAFHRDVLQWTRTIITVILYLEETNLENGATLVVPATHLLPGRSALYLEGEDPFRGTGLLEQAVPAPMPAGGAIVIDSMLIHAPGHNHTDGTRMSMTMGYHAVDELMPIENPARVLVRGKRLYMGNDR